MSFHRQPIRPAMWPVLLLSVLGLAMTKAQGTYQETLDLVTDLKGSVIATPCSIALQNRYQTVGFPSLTLEKLSTQTQREQYSQPFVIELRDCGSMHSTTESKTWSIRFMGQTAENINAFVLQGASQGLGVSVLNNRHEVLIPNQKYILEDNLLWKEKSGKTLFLRYFLRLELTGKSIQAGSYQGLIQFFIDYQ